MKIKKIYQGELPENKILNAQSTSQTDTYSCEYINNLGVGGGENLDELPIGTRVEFNGETIPDGWEEVEETNYNLITDGDGVKAGYQVDGNEVYVKRVNFGALPNNEAKIVDSGVPVGKTIVDFYALIRKSSNYILKLPLTGETGITCALDGGVGNTNYKLTITTTSDRTAWTGMITFYYY